MLGSKTRGPTNVAALPQVYGYRVCRSPFLAYDNKSFSFLRLLARLGASLGAASHTCKTTATKLRRRTNVLLASARLLLTDVNSQQYLFRACFKSRDQLWPSCSAGRRTGNSEPS